MKIVLKMMLFMMRLVPKKLANRMKAPMIPKETRKIAINNPAGIELNLSNLLICVDYCGPCPSKPIKGSEPLYCATGKSQFEVEKNGCNCFECPLQEKCGRGSIGYYCKYGTCSDKAQDILPSETEGCAGEYLEQFLIGLKEEKEAPEAIEENFFKEDVVEVLLNFQGEREVSTTSHTRILRASLDAGIPHTHACGGNARCSTCRVLVIEGINNCRGKNEKEKLLSSKKGFSPLVRLACQTTVKGDVKLRRLVLDEWDQSEAINEGKTSLGIEGREENLAILFSDIRAFTAFSERNLPYDIVHILNRYFDIMGESIDQNGGYIDKYMGDGIMAIFGLDKQMKGSPSALAVNAALSMTHSLHDFNTYLKLHFDHEFKIGIGIHTGNVIIGNLGFHKKMEFTAIGDTVNTASRIESLNKLAKTSILISEQSYLLVKDDYEWGQKFKAQVKGKEHPIKVYEPIKRLYQ